MVTLKLRKIGNSVGVTFPQETLRALRVDDGDTLFLTEAPGGFRLTPYDPKFERQMAAAEEVMRQNRDVLRELAKR
jgi:putative addiction module antidote